MIALPGVVEHLTSKTLIHLLLICIFALSILLPSNTIGIFLEAVMRPETIIEGERLVLTSFWIDKLSCGSLHFDTTFGITFDFSIVEGPDPNRNFNTHFVFFNGVLKYQFAIVKR
jgi:hypothetical protein